jgi:integrase
MAKFNLNLRTAHANEETPVHVVIRWQNQKIAVNTGYYAHPSEWDKKKQRLDTSPSNRKRLLNTQTNAHLTHRISEAERLFVEFETMNKRQPTPEELRAILNDGFGRKGAGAPKNEGLFEFMESLLNEIANGVNPKNGKPYAAQTPGTYRQCLNKLKDYAIAKKRRVDFDTITLDFYLSFMEYLTGQGFKKNYVGKIIKTLKTFLNEAVERGLTTNTAHKGRRFVAPREKVSNIYLNEEELTAIFNLDLTKQPRLENVRDLFLFGCYTGLRFSDFSKVKPENIDTAEGVIDIQTQKTGERVSIPILPITKAILKKYEGKTTNGLPQSISNQKFNKYLKEIAVRLSELHTLVYDEYVTNGKLVSKPIPKWQKVTTHTARRSFATNMFKRDIPTYTIMKITGHRTEAAFLTYLKISPRDSAKIIMRDYESKLAINQ